jgi:hypothetical protein
LVFDGTLFGYLQLCGSFLTNYDMGIIWLDDLATKELGVVVYGQ